MKLFRFEQFSLAASPFQQPRFVVACSHLRFVYVTVGHKMQLQRVELLPPQRNVFDVQREKKMDSATPFSPPLLLPKFVRHLILALLLEAVPVSCRVLVVT